MKELKAQIKNKTFSRCYLFYGTEEYLKKSYETALTKAMIPADAETMNHDYFIEKDAVAAAIMDATETLPFLNDMRLVTVRNSDFFRKGGRKEEGEKLRAWLETIPETTCLLFVEEQAEKSNALYKAVAKMGKVVEFSAPTEKELISWLQKECKAAKTVMTNTEAVSFLRYVGGDMEQLSRELSKLLDYCGGRTITKEDMEAVCTPSFEAKVFDLVKAVANHRCDQALLLYHRLLDGKESPYLILSMMARQFRFILQANGLSQKGLTNAEIAQQLSVQEFAVREYLRQGKTFAENTLKQAIADCLQTDLDIKNGRISDEAAVELFLIRYSK